MPTDAVEFHNPPLRTVPTSRDAASHQGELPSRRAIGNRTNSFNSDSYICAELEILPPFPQPKRKSLKVRSARQVSAIISHNRDSMSPFNTDSGFVCEAPGLADEYCRRMSPWFDFFNRRQRQQQGKAIDEVVP